MHSALALPHAPAPHWDRLSHWPPADTALQASGAAEAALSKAGATGADSPTKDGAEAGLGTAQAGDAAGAAGAALGGPLCSLRWRTCRGAGLGSCTADSSSWHTACLAGLASCPAESRWRTCCLAGLVCRSAQSSRCCSSLWPCGACQVLERLRKLLSSMACFILHPGPSHSNTLAHPEQLECCRLISPA